MVLGAKTKLLEHQNNLRYHRMKLNTIKSTIDTGRTAPSLNTFENKNYGKFLPSLNQPHSTYKDISVPRQKREIITTQHALANNKIQSYEPKVSFSVNHHHQQQHVQQEKKSKLPSLNLRAENMKYLDNSIHADSVGELKPHNDHDLNYYGGRSERESIPSRGEENNNATAVRLLRLAHLNKVNEAIAIIKSGEDINYEVVDRQGCTLLLLAAKKGLYKLSKAILKAGANPNASDMYGNTALHYAKGLGMYKLANLLILHHADESKKNKEGVYPGDFVILPSTKHRTLKERDEIISLQKSTYLKELARRDSMAERARLRQQQQVSHERTYGGPTSDSGDSGSTHVGHKASAAFFTDLQNICRPELPPPDDLYALKLRELRLARQEKLAEKGRLRLEEKFRQKEEELRAQLRAELLSSEGKRRAFEKREIMRARQVEEMKLTSRSEESQSGSSEIVNNRKGNLVQPVRTTSFADRRPLSATSLVVPPVGIDDDYYVGTPPINTCDATDVSTFCDNQTVSDSYHEVSDGEEARDRVWEDYDFTEYGNDFEPDDE